MGKDFECCECGYTWTSKKSVGSPSFCPSCKSKNIDDIGKETDQNSVSNESRSTVTFSTLLNINEKELNRFIDAFHQLISARDKGICQYRRNGQRIIGDSVERTFLYKRPVFSIFIEFKIIENSVNFYIKMFFNTWTKYFSQENIKDFNKICKELINDTYKVLGKVKNSDETNYCIECGKEIKSKFKFCPNCGKKQ